MSVESEIADLLDRMVWEVAGALGLDIYDELRVRIPNRAAVYAAQLTGDDPAIAAETAQGIGRWAGDDTEDDAWWGTDLGRAVAATFLVGGPGDEAVTVSHARAAELLGVSRGRISQMADEGKLERGVGGSILRASVGRLMAERARI